MTVMRAALPCLVAALLTAPAHAYKRVPFDKAVFEAAAQAAAEAGLTGVIAVTDTHREIFRLATGPEAGAKLWPWGSLSKQVAAALTMRLIDKGRLTLETAIGGALPDFPNSQKAGVTVRQLLTHTTGLASPETTTPGENGVPSFYLRSDPRAGTRDDAVGYCAGTPSGPTGGYAYNNCDTIVLGAVLEASLGRQLSSLLQDEIAKPAGMTSLRFATPGEHPVEARGGEGKVPRINIATMGIGGALVGTVADALAFDRALMNGTLVSDKGTAVMWTGDPALGFAAFGALAFSAPLAGCDGEVKLIERRGSIDGVQMRNIIAPDEKLALVIFTDNADAAFGDIREGEGVSYDLASAAFCAKSEAEKEKAEKEKPPG
ncbi:MAG: serine hydrolase domain-containing protein [Micropepsaceae bacterium]